MNHQLIASLHFLFSLPLFDGYIALLLIMSLGNYVIQLTQRYLSILKRHQIIKRYEHLKLLMPNWEID